MEVRLTSALLPADEPFVAPPGIGRGNAPAAKIPLSLRGTKTLPNCMGSSWGSGTREPGHDSVKENGNDNV